MIDLVRILINLFVFFSIDAVSIGSSRVDTVAMLRVIGAHFII